MSDKITTDKKVEIIIDTSKQITNLLIGIGSILAIASSSKTIELNLNWGVIVLFFMTLAFGLVNLSHMNRVVTFQEQLTERDKINFHVLYNIQSAFFL